MAVAVFFLSSTGKLFRLSRVGPSSAVDFRFTLRCKGLFTFLFCKVVDFSLGLLFVVLILRRRLFSKDSGQSFQDRQTPRRLSRRWIDRRGRLHQDDPLDRWVYRSQHSPHQLATVLHWPAWAVFWGRLMGRQFYTNLLCNLCLHKLRSSPCTRWQRCQAADADIVAI